MSGAALFIKNSGPLSVTLSLPDLLGERYGAGTAVTLEIVTAVVAEGVTPYTYAWSRTSGHTGILPSALTSADTGFFSYFAAPGVRTATFICTVTDAVSTVVASSAVTIELEAF